MDDGGWDLGSVINDIMGFGRGRSSTPNEHWPWQDAPPPPPPLLFYHEDHELHHVFHPSFTSLHSINDATFSTYHTTFHDSFIPTTTDGNWISDSDDRTHGSSGHTLAAPKNGTVPMDRNENKMDGSEEEEEEEEASPPPSLRDQLITRFKSDQKREKKRMELKKQNLRRMRDEIVMMVDMFAVLMGVIYLGVAATTELSCRDFWGPALLAVAVTTGTVYHVMAQLPKIDRLQCEVHNLHNYIEGLRDFIGEVRKGNSKDVNGCLTLYNEKKDKEKKMKKDKEKEKEEEEEGILEGVHTSPVKCFLVVGSLISFTFVLLLSCIKMLCTGPRCCE